jgi:hypothetical protein
MVTHVEREPIERDEREEAATDESEVPYDGGFARLDPPGTEPSED